MCRECTRCAGDEINNGLARTSPWCAGDDMNDRLASTSLGGGGKGNAVATCRGDDVALQMSRMCSWSCDIISGSRDKAFWFGGLGDEGVGYGGALRGGAGGGGDGEGGGGGISSIYAYSFSITTLSFSFMRNSGGGGRPGGS